MKWKFLVICSLIAALNSPLSAFGKQTPPPAKTSTTQAMTALKEVSEGFSLVADKAIPAVVNIKATFDQPNISEPSSSYDEFFHHFFGPMPPQTEPAVAYGSGFFVSEDGYILTNNHVVKNATEVKVSLADGSEYEAKIIGSDPYSEVALIKVEGKNFPYLNLANSDDVKVGQWAIAIGSPFGFEASVTVGIVSATGRRAIVGNSNWENYIQTDAAINPGNSGGPLININGEVIGINTAIYTKTGGYLGIGFAIPSNIAEHVAEQLFEHGSVQRGYLGIYAQSLTPDLAKALNLNSHQGVVIVEVSPGSPADKGGLKQQDVIVQINGKPFTNKTNLTHEVSLMKPGSKMTLTINRNGKTKEVELIVGTYPSGKGLATAGATAQSALGVNVENLTPQYAKQLGYEGLSGVVVTEVKHNSPMAFASIRPGTLIMAVNRQNVTNVDEFYQSVAEAEKNKNILLLVRYGRMSRYITITLK